MNVFTRQKQPAADYFHELRFNKAIAKPCWIIAFSMHFWPFSDAYLRNYEDRPSAPRARGAEDRGATVTPLSSAPPSLIRGRVKSATAAVYTRKVVEIALPLWVRL